MVRAEINSHVLFYVLPSQEIIIHTCTQFTGPKDRVKEGYDPAELELQPSCPPGSTEKAHFPELLARTNPGFAKPQGKSCKAEGGCHTDLFTQHSLQFQSPKVLNYSSSVVHEKRHLK